MRGDQIKALRNKAKLSSKQLSDLTGISESTLSRIMLDQSEPRFEDIVSIVRVTGGSLDELAGLKPVTDEEVTRLQAQVDTQRIQLANYDNILANYNKLLAEKETHAEYLRKIIRWLAIGLSLVLVVFLGIIVYDVMNGSIGWARYQEVIRSGVTDAVSIITDWLHT